MNQWPVFLLALVSCAGLGLAVMYFARYSAARESLLILARINTDKQHSSELQIMAVRPKRIAENDRLRSWLRGAPLIQPIAELLEQSGEPTTVASFLGATLTISFLLLVVGLLVGLHPPAAMGLSFFGTVFPVAYFNYKRDKRAAKFESQLPQALELIALYLRSGRSLPQAFIATSEELLAPASEEFLACAEEYRLGRPLEAALKRLAVKYPNAIGFRLFTTAVSVLNQTGGNLVEVLERIKKTLDAGITYTLKLQAMTGDARTSANILGGLPGLFMVGAAILNPGYFNEFFETRLGVTLFSMFLTLWLSGLFWVRQLMKSK